ncbi:uncharacterized protein LOC119552814 isoform X2 [Drosophila subpulchrella]|uniref:uncharacterized protein LOC119552814 isoform X2 n=1 Tax=Drosophila subpulchrella TaxID=1486046 RepID=UPI0018A129D9|nr:uncharacterized protein LOC119552814 isoform X2 [Drosophila subpulchrella]
MNWIWSLLVLGIVFGATEGRIEQPQRQAETPTAPAGDGKKPDKAKEPDDPKKPESPAVEGNSTTAKDKYTLEEERVTNDLKDIVSKYERECIGNPEFSANLDKIRKAINWNNGTLQQKYELQFEFNNYNKLRIDLDKKIDIAIEELNDVLPTLQPNSSCSKLLLKQRKALQKAKQLSNEGKLDSLRENSKQCVDTDNDSSEYDY